MWPAGQNCTTAKIPIAETAIQFNVKNAPAATPIMTATISINIAISRTSANIVPPLRPGEIQNPILKFG